jgi:hypothetical protein
MIHDRREFLEIAGRPSGLSAFRQTFEALKEKSAAFGAVRGSQQGLDRGLFQKTGEVIYAVLSFM